MSGGFPQMIARDYVIVAAYILASLAVGFWSSRRGGESSRSFFVAEKALPWWVVGFTMVAASISAEQMLGEVGYGFGAGLVVSNWDLGVFPALLLMVMVFLPLYLRSGITTVPEYLERRYGRSCRLLFAGYTVFNNACVTLVMVLALGAMATKYFIGLDPLYGAAILAVFTGVYTVYGGMAAVAWTDTFQCLVLLAGGLYLVLTGLGKVPGGLEGLLERMPDPHLIRPIDDPYVPWPGLILLMLSTNVWYCCTNQFYVQSCLGARTEREGRMGVLLTAFLAPVLTLCFAFPGYIAADLLEQKVIAPLPLAATGEPDANAVYPHLVSEFFAPGIRGFMVAAVLAAIMSSVSAIVNGTASVFTNDLYRAWLCPGAGEKQLVRVGRIAGLLTLVIAYPLTLAAMRYRYIFTYSQNAWCILAIPIMLVFTCGALWRRATHRAAVATFVCLAPFVVVPFIWGNPDDNWLDLPFVSSRVHLFNFAFVLWLAAAALMVTVSLLTRPPDPQAVESCVWTPAKARAWARQGPGEPWHRRVGFWTAVAGLMFAAIYARFW